MIYPIFTSASNNSITDIFNVRDVGGKFVFLSERLILEKHSVREIDKGVRFNKTDCKNKIIGT